MKAPIYIGYWFEPVEGFSGLPKPQELVRQDWAGGDKLKLVNYLKKGITFMQYRGYSTCRFECGVPMEQMGDRDLTDGTWVWPEGLWHYVEKHNIILPEDFITHCRSSKWEITGKGFPEEVCRMSDYEFGYWINWCSSVLQ